MGARRPCYLQIRRPASTQEVSTPWRSGADLGTRQPAGWLTGGRGVRSGVSAGSVTMASRFRGNPTHPTPGPALLKRRHRVRMDYTTAMTMTTSLLRERAAAARAAARTLARVSTADKDAALARIAGLLETEQAPILEANARDLAAARQPGLDDYFIERLTLNPDRLRGIAADTRKVMTLDDPVGEVFDSRTLPNGLLIGRRRVPLGVVACIYESRPNVTVDIAVLCLKSGNESLRSGRTTAAIPVPAMTGTSRIPRNGRPRSPAGQWISRSPRMT